MLWSEPFKSEYPGGVDMQVVVPVYCLGEAEQYDRLQYVWRGPGPPSSRSLEDRGKEGGEGGAMAAEVKLRAAVEASRSILNKLSSSASSSSSASPSPSPSPSPCIIRVSKMTEAGPMAFLAVLVGVNLELTAPGCLKLNLTSLGSEPQWVVHNATSHALRFKESR